MFRKIGIATAFLLLLTVLCMTQIHPTNAADTIYIRADGSIEPPTAPISSLDNVTYTITGDINTTIVVERGNITIDGAGKVVHGTGTGNGISLQNISNVTIKNSAIRSFYYGIYFANASNNMILENTVFSNSYDGIYLSRSAQNVIQGNNIVSNGNDGVKLVQGSDSNSIAENMIALNNDDGIQIDRSIQSNIFKNNLIGNSKAGINIGYSSRDQILLNNATNNQYGIMLVNSTQEDVQMNWVNGNGVRGISLVSVDNSTLSHNDIVNSYDGFYVYSSSQNEISDNSVISNTHYGIVTFFSSNNKITTNNITGSSTGIRLTQFSDSNIILTNTVADNFDGIFLSSSSRNNIQANNIMNNNNWGLSLLFNSQNSRLYHNNFINNTNQASTSSFNYWDNGLPDRAGGEGNYWSDYNPQDFYPDGIGGAHLINGTNVDHVPLLGKFSSFNAALGNYVNVISNSTVLDFQSTRSPSNITIKMVVSNFTSTQTAGFSRICIPHTLMTEPFDVTINGTAPNFANYTLFDNSTHRWIYFNYGHSVQEIIITGTDIVPPAINIISPENKTYATANLPLDFTVNEPTSWIGYSLDGQENQTIAGNTTLSGLSEESHSLTIYANDTVGNMGTSTVQFLVHTTIPTIQILSPENKTYTTNTIPLEYIVDEATSWVGYSLDSQANQTITGNTTLSGLSDGSHVLTIYANDTFGNMGISTVQFDVHATIPSIQILSPENRIYAIANIPLTYTVNEPLSWTAYSLDGQANVTITGNTTLSSLSDAHHIVVIYGNDSIGNMRTSNVAQFTVDVTSPNIANVNQLPLYGYVTPDDKVQVDATITDSTSGIKNVYLNYTTNNLTWTRTTMTKLTGNVWNGTIPAFPEGTNVTYVIIAQDNADNIFRTGGFGYYSSYEVIPEFPTLAAVLLAFIVTSLIMAEAQRRRKHKVPLFLH